jgi:hypothetical protein
MYDYDGYAKFMIDSYRPKNRVMPFGSVQMATLRVQIQHVAQRVFLTAGNQLRCMEIAEHWRGRTGSELVHIEPESIRTESCGEQRIVFRGPMPASSGCLAAERLAFA